MPSKIQDKYGEVKLNDYKTALSNNYIDISLKEAANTFQVDSRLGFYADEKIVAIDNTGDTLLKITKPRFRVIIGTSINLKNMYIGNTINNHEKIEDHVVNIIDKVYDFIPKQFTFKDQEQESVGKAVNEDNNIIMLIVGCGKLNNRKTKKPLNYYKEMIVAALVLRPNKISSYILWLAVEGREYNESVWGVKTKSRDGQKLEFRTFTCHGFGHFLLASAQQYQLMLHGNSKLVLQAIKDKQVGYYMHHMHFSEIAASDFQLHCENLGESFIKDMAILESNCEICRINVGVYDDKKDQKAIEDAVRIMKNTYFKDLQSLLEMTGSHSETTKICLKQQFPDLAHDMRRASCNTRHSVVQNDTTLSNQSSSENVVIVADNSALLSLLNDKNNDQKQEFDIIYYNDQDTPYGSLLETISMVIFGKKSTAKYLKFALSFIYEVLHRIHSDQHIFNDKNNKEFFANGLELLRKFRSKKQAKTDDLDSIQELTPSLKKELLLYVARDYEHNFRNDEIKILEMDMSIISLLLDIKIVTYSAITKANVSIFYKQRAWRETLVCMPKLMIANDQKSSMTSYFNKFIALSYHENSKFGSIQVKPRIHPLPDAICYVKAIAENIYDNQDDQYLVEKKTEWLLDRTGKKYSNQNILWESDDVMRYIDKINLLAFYRIYDPMQTKYLINSGTDVLSLVEKNKQVFTVNMESFYSLHPNVWVKTYVIERFIASLDIYEPISNGKVVIMSPTDVSEINFVNHDLLYDVDRRRKPFSTHYYQSYIERINKEECEMVYFIVHDNGCHYYCVELDIKLSKLTETFQLRIADSLDDSARPQSWLQYYEIVNKSKILLLLNELRPSFNYNFERANNLSIQNDGIECAIHCCRRVYSYVTKGRVVEPNNIDIELAEPKNFRLIMINNIISNATFMSRYISPTGSFPAKIMLDMIPMPITPKVQPYNTIRTTQFPSQMDLSIEQDNSNISCSDFDKDSFGTNSLYQKNDEKYLEVPNSPSIWSQSVNSRNRFNNDDYEVRILQMSSIQSVEDLTIDTPKRTEELPNNINIRNDDKSEVSSMPSVNATTDQIINVEKIDKTKIKISNKRGNSGNLNNDNKKSKDSVPETSYTSNEKKKLNFIKKQHEKIKATIALQNEPTNNINDIKKQPKNKPSISQKEILASIKEWDLDKPSKYQNFVNRDVVNCVTKAFEDDLVNRRIAEVKKIRSGENDNEIILKNQWEQFLYNKEQLDETELENTVIKTIDSEIAELERKINLKKAAHQKEKDGVKKIGTENAKMKKLKIAINDLKSLITMKEWEKNKTRIFHKSDSIYALRIVGDVSNERKWKYFAVYKAKDGKFFESRISITWLKDNFDHAFLETWKNHHIMGEYLIIRTTQMNFVSKFPTDAFFAETKEKFCSKLWSYKNAEYDYVVTNLRAVVNFVLKKNATENLTHEKNDISVDDDRTEATDKTVDLGLVTGLHDMIESTRVSWSILFGKGGRQVPNKNSNRLNSHSYFAIEEKDMLDIFGIDKLNAFRRQYIQWWYQDQQKSKEYYSNNNTMFCIYYKDKNSDQDNDQNSDQDNDQNSDQDNDKKNYRYIDEKDNDNFFEYVSKYKNKQYDEKTCVKSPLGHRDQPQVYYWSFYDKEKFIWNETLAQISMIKWDKTKNSFVGKEWDMDEKRKKTVNLPITWVEKNFPELIPKLKEFADLMDVPKFFQVPLADGRNTNINSNATKNPIISFHQTDNKSCCFYSLCCALKYLSFNDEAVKLKLYRDYFFEKLYLENFYKIDTCIIDHLRESKDFMRLQSSFNIFPITRRYNLFTNKVSDRDIRLVVLAGNDGSESHAVCIVDKFIFDSNCMFALDFNKAGLNDCCNGHEFLHVVRGYYFKSIF